MASLITLLCLLALVCSPRARQTFCGTFSTVVIILGAALLFTWAAGSRPRRRW